MACIDRSRPNNIMHSPIELDVDLCISRYTISYACANLISHGGMLYQVHNGYHTHVYQAFVISIFTYGCEAWILDKSTTDFIGSWNSRNLLLLTTYDSRNYNDMIVMYMHNIKFYMHIIIH